MADAVMSGDNVVMTPEDPNIAGRVEVTAVFLDHGRVLSVESGVTVVLGLRFSRAVVFRKHETKGRIL
jgi:hypothetical protein